MLTHSVEMEKKIANGNIKRLNAVIKNGCRDIKVLDSLADPLFDTMLGLSGIGERTYLRFIKYLRTFNPAEAKERYEMYEDTLGYKIHLAYIAAHLAKDIHQNQVDKAGQDYFEGHLAAVGGKGFGWKEKTVGFLHDVAEDTEYTVKDIIRFLKRGLKEWKANPDEQDWIEDFCEIVGQYPNRRLHLPTKEEWNEIEDALNLLNSKTSQNREEYIQRLKGHFLAIKVKMNDLRHNMDISRIPEPTENDYARIGRYQKEYNILLDMLGELYDAESN